jgi:hypothetical protein
MKYHHYNTLDGGVIRVRANRKPSELSAPANGTWVCYELSKEGKWEMPCIPQITWRTLSKFEYLGFQSIPRAEQSGKENV